MTALTNHLRAFGFVQSEANGEYSRDHVTILGGSGGAGKLIAGTVLGKITASKKYVASPDTGSDGSQTAVAILGDQVDATAGDVLAAVLSRSAEVRAADLTYDATVSDGTKIAAKVAQLAAAGVGIIVRS